MATGDHPLSFPSASAEPTRRVRVGGWGRWLPIAVLGPLLGYLVVVPLVLLLVSSFKESGFPTDPGLTLANYAGVYLNPGFLTLLWNTLAFVVGSVVMALTLGVVLAWLVERTDLPGRGLVRALIILPMATPPILLAIAWVMLLSPRTGFFNGLLRDAFGLSSAPFDIFSLNGMIFVEGLALVPTTFLILSPAFRNMDPNLEEAAFTSGAGTWMVLRRIILPMLLPAILAAGVFLAIVGFVVFDIPGTLGVPVRIFVLSSQIYFYANQSTTGLPQYGLISAMAATFLVVLFVLGIAYQRFTRHVGRYVTITGKGFRVRPYRLRRWRYPALGLVGLYFFLAVLAPLSILVWTSLMPYQSRVSLEMLSELSLRNHQEFFSNSRILQAARNSIVIALVAGAVVALLSAVVSWVSVRSRAPGRKVLDMLAFVPVAIPGIMMGVALIYVYLTIRVVPIYGTIWIIAIAYITDYLAYGTRTTNGVMAQMHSELEEAAQTSGASWLRTFRRITVPLMLPALVAVWLWVVSHAIRELSAALMLQGRENTVLSTLLWDYWSGGQPTTAAAVGVWMIVALVVLVAAWQIAARRGAVSSLE